MPLMTAGALPMQLAAWSDNAGEVGAAIGAVLMARGGPPPPLEVPGHRLEFGKRTLVMGILNVTPNSFSGDGVGDDVAAAVARAQALAEAGADIVDIGGESTRPSRNREEVSRGGRDGAGAAGDPRAGGPAPGPDQHRHAQGGGRRRGTRRRGGDRQRRLGVARRSGAWPRSSPRTPERGWSPCTTSTGPTTAISWRTSASACARASRSPRRPVSRRPR